MKDINYKEIKIGATVDVPAPNSEDAHNNEFRGTVTGFVEGGYVVVEDMEENSYCIESERLEVIDLETEEKEDNKAIQEFLKK
jgi:hypothetical protein